MIHFKKLIDSPPHVRMHKLTKMTYTVYMIQIKMQVLVGFRALVTVIFASLLFQGESNLNKTFFCVKVENEIRTF